MCRLSTPLLPHETLAVIQCLVNQGNSPEAQTKQTRFIPKWHSTSRNACRLRVFGVKHIIKSFELCHSVPLSFEVQQGNEPGLWATEPFSGHLLAVWMVATAGLVFLDEGFCGEVTPCKQCYQADSRRKCPSSAERSDRSSPSRWYFRLLDAGPGSLFWKPDIKEVTHWWACVFLHIYLNNFIASSVKLGNKWFCCSLLFQF